MSTDTPQSGDLQVLLEDFRRFLCERLALPVEVSAVRNPVILLLRYRAGISEADRRALESAAGALTGYLNEMCNRPARWLCVPDDVVSGIEAVATGGEHV